MALGASVTRDQAHRRYLLAVERSRLHRNGCDRCQRSCFGVSLNCRRGMALDGAKMKALDAYYAAPSPQASAQEVRG
jgi:hypothetical protein